MRKRNIRKAAAALTALALCAGVLSGCGGTASSTASSAASSSAAASSEASGEDADEAAAKNVADLIDAIYVQERNDNTDEQCAAAKAAWDALTDAQKELVEGENADPDYFGRDTGDASKDAARNEDNIGENELLVVSFGTSFNDSRVKDIKGIEDALQAAYPDWNVRRAFTAQIIINHVQARDGEKIDNMQQAMDRAVANGVKNLIVQPTHLMHGAEYDEMCAAIDKVRDKFESVEIAEPMLGEVGNDATVINADKEVVAKAITAAAVEASGFDSLEAAKEAGTAFVFMGHGTAHIAKVSYSQMSAQMQNLGYENVFIGTVEGEPEETSCESVIEAVKGMYHNELDNGLKIYFCGNSISPTYLNNIISLCKGKRFSINVISKSGTTTETSLAFRLLRELLEKEMGVEEANKRIYATTDRAKGTLKQLADAQGWPTFVVPDDVGGRYSVLSAVGLLPIAAAGIDIDALMQGAADAMERFSVLSPDNDAYKYAAIRNILYRKGKAVEILECYEPDFTLMNEWYKQLFGESEGKDNKGLFPASCIFSTDLHSMGQFIQEGSRTMFETIVDVKKPAKDLFIDPLEGNFDGLNFLANQNMSVVNRKAMEGTILAHTDGGVPEVLVEVDDLSAYNVGYLIYFFWRACACSGYLLSVNPFNQPGVESYKKNMFALLGKPGYEGLTAELEAKLK